MKNILRKRSHVKKALRIISIILVAGVIVAAIIASMSAKPANADIVWDKDMTIGNLDAKNYYITYSDLMCPYCIAFESATIEHKEEFEKYLEDNDILYEVRVSDFLYEYGEARAINSRYSAEAVYCAKNEGRFWDYYDLAVTTLWNDYFKGSGKGAFAKVNEFDKSYWIDLGKQIGLGDKFEKCVKNDEPLDEIKVNAAKSAKLINGMPYFKFNSFTSSGFDPSGSWDYAKMYLDAGLGKG